MTSLPRCAGIMTPLFALRRNADCGIGDLGALKKLIDWCHNIGLKFILLLPVNTCGRDYSPYNAISSVALEPLYLDLQDMELFRELNVDVSAESSALGSVNSAFVDYESVYRKKHFFLQKCFEKFTFSWEFSRYLERNRSWLDAYALFLALSEKFLTCDFIRWPTAYRNFSLAALIDDPVLELRSKYHKFCQWLCDNAWRRIKRYAEEKNVLLFGDLPFSISRQSADVWQHPERFSSVWNAGAPPEPNFQDDPFVCQWGQNWGLPLYDWDGQEKSGHSWWRERLDAMSRFFHGYRLDHALGYFRVYAFPWNPSHNSEYVSKTPELVLSEGGLLPRFFPGPDDNLQNKLINLEHGRRFFRFVRLLQPRLFLIAEDLGVVPDYVRPFLEEIEVPGMKIPQFERLQPDLRYLPVENYPEVSFATWATHDHPPLAALWQKWQEHRHHSGADEWEIRCFLNFLGHSEDRREHTLPNDLHLAAISKISTSRSSLLCLQMTDWFNLTIRYNQPGLQSNKNWSARLPFTVESLSTDRGIVEKTKKILQILKQTARIPDAKKISTTVLF